jgi:hypothetical protein
MAAHNVAQIVALGVMVAPVSASPEGSGIKCRMDTTMKRQLHEIFNQRNTIFNSA